jgi:SAM-dependent methyltransferase
VEVNLLNLYPTTKRRVDERATKVTDEHRAIARKFGKEYFDGSRLTGYGGYSYHARFWQPTVKRIRDYYRLAPDASVLDIGCAKGFMLHDFKELMPDIMIAGVDISEYAIENAMLSVKQNLQLGDARALPFPDKSFELVTAINTIHNLPIDGCKQALREIQRVSRSHSFLVVDAWRTDRERQNIMDWVLTAQTCLHVDEWKELFKETGYSGDYYWFILDHESIDSPLN